MYKKNEDTNKWVHREIYEMKFGRIPKGYHVHHIDKNPTNNNLDNLVSVPEEFHIQLHELDKLGVILRTKLEVSIALAFYLRGKRNNKLEALSLVVKKIQTPKESNKKRKRVHYNSLIRRQF